jgi:cell division protein FtsW (lipid II flippase)
MDHRTRPGLIAAQNRINTCEVAMLYEIGTFLVELTESKTGVFIFGVASGLIPATVMLIATHALRNVSHPTVLAAFFVGITMAIIACIEAAATRSRRLRVFEDVAKVADLNHHVRNALQAIQYATHMPAGMEQIQIIEDGVKRIDETLRHLFPVVTVKAGMQKSA